MTWTGSGNPKYTHGGCGTELYNHHKTMKKRCNNKNDTRYNHYGGRGITYCPEWEQFAPSFRDWSSANGFVEGQGLTLERIDNDGNYEPSNCRWIPLTEQALNRSNTIRIEYGGIIYSMPELSEQKHIDYLTLWHRYQNGDRGEKLVRPVQPISFEHDGQILTLRELSEKTHIDESTLWKRYKHGDRGERLVRPIQVQHRR
jgi:hypothetical protein